METRQFESASNAAPPVVPASPSVGFPTNGNPATAIPATVPGAYWYYQIAEEMRHVVTDAGLTPDETDLTQLNQGIRILSNTEGLKTFLSVTAMITDTKLKIGQLVYCLGYNSIGDGGANIFKIVGTGTGTVDGGRYIDLTGITGQAEGQFAIGPINVRQFGAHPSATAAVNQVAMQAAIDYSDQVFCPAGVYTLSGTLTKTLGVSEDLTIQGDAVGASILIFDNAGGNGVDITQTLGGSQFNSDEQSIVIERLSLKTTSVNSGRAISIQNSGGQGQTARPVRLNRLNVSGYIDNVNSTWADGIYINAATFSTISDYNFLGSNSLGNGLRFESTDNAVDNNITNFRQLGGDSMAVITGRYEGFYFVNVLGINVQNGIHWNATLGVGETAQPLLSVDGGHINCISTAIKTEDVVQVIISGILFYTLAEGGVGIDVSVPFNTTYVQETQLTINGCILHGATAGAGTDAIKLSNFVTGAVIDSSSFTFYNRVLTYDSTVRDVKLTSDNKTKANVAVLSGAYEETVYHEEPFLNAGTQVGFCTMGVCTFAARHIVSTVGAISSHVIPIPNAGAFKSEIKSVTVSFSGVTNIDGGSYVVWDALANTGDINNIHIKVYNALTDNDVDISYIAAGV